MVDGGRLPECPDPDIYRDYRGQSKTGGVDGFFEAKAKAKAEGRTVDACPNVLQSRTGGVDGR